MITSNKTEIATPKIKEPIIEVDKKLLEDFKQQTNTEQQVIVHCYLHPEEFFTRIRIWRSTYLRDLNSSHRSKLLNAYKISFYPQWTYLSGMAKINFTLVFEALPKQCKIFDLYEDIPVSNGFYTGEILRSVSDVYQVKIAF